MIRVDTFPFNNELDLLECRLTELDTAVDYFVLVEANTTHGGDKPKPYHYLENADRFAAWADRIIPIQATDLPDDPDAWSREKAQREWIGKGLATLDLGPNDIVLQSDVDEIPTHMHASLVQPRGFVVFEQTLYCFAVDWQHPDPWRGTVASTVRNIGSFAAMRDARLFAPTVLPAAGWHLSWLGGEQANVTKMDSFCHPEIEPAWRGRLGECYDDGVHVDGVKLLPVDVDESWPEWIVEGNAPTSWFRAR